MSLNIRPDRTLVRAPGGSIRYALVDLAAPQATLRADRAPVNVALILDRSGSMGGGKIILARRAIEHALHLLHPQDRLTLVAFDDVVDVVVESTLATSEARRDALARLREIEARGSTNLAGGWLAGCDQVVAHLTGQALGRCLLVTDGLANVGVSEPDQLAALVASMRDRGVATSTFGLGADFDEVLLRRMAEAGHGHFYFVETPQAIPDLLTTELGEALEIVARDVAVVARAPEGVDVAPLGSYQVAAAGQVVRIELGDLTSGQELQLVLKLKFPAGTPADTIHVAFEIADGEGVLSTLASRVAWTFAGHSQNDAQPRDRVVDRAVARWYAAIAREAALAHNREGRFEEARQALERVVRKIASYAGTDPDLLRIVAALHAEFEIFATRMDSLQAKRMQFASYAVQRSRTAEGKSRKG